MLKQVLKDIAEESIEILIKPKEHWQKVKEGSDSFSQIFRKFFIPSLVIIFAAVTIGDLLFNSIYGIVLKDSLIKAGRKTAILVTLLYSSMVVIYELARMFKIKADFERARKVAIYSMVPLVIMTTLIGLFPFLDFLGILSLYALVLVYLGLHTLFEIPKAQHIPFLTASLLALLLNGLLITFIFNKIITLIVY